MAFDQNITKMAKKKIEMKEKAKADLDAKKEQAETIRNRQEDAVGKKAVLKYSYQDQSTGEMIDAGTEITVTDETKHLVFLETVRTVKEAESDVKEAKKKAEKPSA